MTAILEVVELLKKARQAEADCGMALADARAELERRKSIAVAEAWQSGQVDGKNEQARKAQEAQAVEASTPVHEAQLLERQLETKHVAARIERQYQEDRYRALLALVPSAGVETP